MAKFAVLFQLLAADEGTPIGVVVGSGGVEAGGAATVLESVLVGTVAGSGGAVAGGAATIVYGDRVSAVTGSGGVKAGGPALVNFVHGGQVASNIVVEWDLDNDGDFSAGVENITSFVRSVETFTGRDWPSLLTGRAGPGKLRASLRNDDDRFNYFNAGSPLVTAPYSLKTGRRVRVRASEASSPDPTLLARDRFRRADGALGDDETGLTYVEPLDDDFAIEGSRAVATGEGETHMAVLDVGSADYYVQARMGSLGSSANRVGVVYRYVDSNDYSICVLNAELSLVELFDVVAGVETPVASRSVEVYSQATIGVLVEGASVTAFLEGVLFCAGVAANTSAESVGIYAEWASGDDRPEIDDLFVWDGLPAHVEGVLWTGDIAELVSSVQAGPEKVATISGEGWLSKLATQRIAPPASLTGRKTGLLLGNVLAGSMLLHPPGRIDEGDVTTGVFAIEESTAMEVARRVEETEFGFLHETQEGHISFASRSARDASTPRATFTDAADGKFGYHRLEPYDWRREVFNRVVAGVSPWTEGEEATLFTDPGPYALSSGHTQMLQASYSGTVVRWTGHTREIEGPSFPVVTSAVAQDSSGTPTMSFDVSLPGAVSAGDLLLLLQQNADDPIYGHATSIPEGWTRIAGYNVFVKVAEGDEGGTSVTLSAFSPIYWAAQMFHITAWHGSIEGVKAVEGAYSRGLGEQANPPGLSPPWGGVPTLYIAAHLHRGSGSLSQTGIPAGYSDGLFVQDGYASLGTARRQVAGAASEDPGPFQVSPTPGSQTAYTIGIRGGGISSTQVSDAAPSGTNPSFAIGYVASLGGATQAHSNIEVTGVPLVQGDQQLVQADNYVSQDEHNAIRTYTNPANLFATAADATAYAELVLATHADDRPILSMSFYATKSKAYRAQALRRRVGDRITLVADHNSGFGIERDFFIEAISHKFSHGVRLWETTWELSPA